MHGSPNLSRCPHRGLFVLALLRTGTALYLPDLGSCRSNPLWSHSSLHPLPNNCAGLSSSNLWVHSPASFLVSLFLPAVPATCSPGGQCPLLSVDGTLSASVQFNWHHVSWATHVSPVLCGTGQTEQGAHSPSERPVNIWGAENRVIPEPTPAAGLACGMWFLKKKRKIITAV